MTTSCMIGSKLVRFDSSEAAAVCRSVLVVLSSVDDPLEVSELPTSGGVDEFGVTGPSAWGKTAAYFLWTRRPNSSKPNPSGTSKVPVTLKSVDRIMRFDERKTYVLFGLTSDLGQSLVDWMESHGAKNVVLTSRHPNIDARWLDQCRAKGMRVEVFAK